MKPLLAFLLLFSGIALAQTPDLTLARDKNWLVIQGPHLPCGEIRINYLEAYCRTNSTTADWHDTTIGHTTELLSLSEDKKTMKLRCTVKDGMIVNHTITASTDDVTFAITAHNPTATASGAHWAQPCIRLGDFTGYDNKGKDIDDYLPKCFLFLDGKLTRMSDIKPWSKEARYIPGQVWCPKNVPRTDVNPRPLSPLVPSNGLIGCFSGDEKQLFAVAFDPYQELFQGVARCLHSDFRIGGMKPGETKHIKGKIYILPNDVPVLLTRYAKDFPGQQLASPFQKADFIVPPEVIIRHTPERSFIGPGMFVLENGDILMAAPWGRPPTNFEQLAAKFPVPMLYRSADGGRTWKEQGRMKMEWNLTGLISDGGTSFLRLPDGRIAVVFNRHVKGLHGGGAPVIAFSADNGQTWTAAKVLIENNDAFYVMNDRLIQLRSGRLVLPVARKVGKTEGDRDEGLAMLSDDEGATWRLSRGTASMDAPRGMAEPCVAELNDGRVLMMGRTGLGSHHVALSSDGGETWSKPEPTTLESACSSLTLKTLPDRRLIVFYNHAAPIKSGAFFPRTPLSYAVSDDSGKTWSPPVIVDDEGAANKDRQNIYPSACFTKEGMVLMWSTHGADPNGSFAGQYDPNIGGGKRAILPLPKKSASAAGERPPEAGPRRVIVPLTEEAGRNGKVSLIELRDGPPRLMDGAHQKTDEWDRGAMRQMRAHDGGKTWSASETVFTDLQRSLYQVSFARPANDDLGLSATPCLPVEVMPSMSSDSRRTGANPAGRR